MRASPTVPAAPARLRAALLAGLAAACLLVRGPALEAAPVRVWVPPSADTLLMWSSEARVMFQSNTGDSVTGGNYRAYERVGRMGEWMLSAMGRAGMRQALHMENVLDSLGLDVDVEIDPELPYFVLMMVRNPFRPGAESVAYLYWYRQNTLRVQGVAFRGGRQPRSRVWWTGTATAPYSWGILDEQLADPPRLGLTLLRLSPDGHVWNVIQFPTDSTSLGGPGTADWADVNRDGVPEAVTFVRGRPDASFAECRNCPGLVTQSTFVERKQGFQIEERRLVPSAFANFTLFVRLLQDGQTADAARLVSRPALVETALGYGMNRRGEGVWRYEYGEPDEAWPRWMAFSLEAADGKRTAYVIRFGHADGRWIIDDIAPAPVAPPAGTPGPAR